MKKRQAAELLDCIKSAYPNFFKNIDIENAQSIFAFWYSHLKDYEFDIILTNLNNYVKNNRFAPSIADLVNPAKEERDRYIPNVEETQEMLKQMEQDKERVKNDPKVQEAKEQARKEIAKILGRG